MSLDKENRPVFKVTKKEPKKDHCPICKGVNSPHPSYEPNSKLGSSWWKLVGFNAPNLCAVTIRENQLKELDQ